MAKDAYFRLSEMELVVIGKYNKKIEAIMGKVKYTERDARVLRVASMLCFELFNETIEENVARLATVLTQKEAKRSYDVIMGVLKELLPHIENLKLKEGDDVPQREKFQFKAKVINELIRFLENVRNLVENGVSYVIDDHKFVIYQNEDFRQKTLFITNAVDEQWNQLTSGFSLKGEILKLKDLNREVCRMMNVPIKLDLDRHNKMRDIKIEDVRDPRQFGEN